MAVASEVPSSASSGGRWLSAAASLLVGAAFFALWFWLLPQWLGFRVETAVRRGGDGWRRFRRCWDLRLRCVAFGILVGRDGARPRRLLRRRTWSWWVFTVTCGTRCTSVLRSAGSGCGSSSDMRIRLRLHPWRQLLWACICLWSSTKNQLCAGSLGRTTSSIART